MLSKAYWNNSVPVGWDTPVYTHLTKLIMKEGISGLLHETSYSHFYSIFSSFFTIYRLIDPFSLEIVLPIILSFLAVILVGFVLLKWFDDPKVALFGAFFAIGWYTLFSLAASLHRNLMAVVFLLIILAYLPRYFKHRTFFLTSLFSALAFLMILTQWETYIISVVILCVYAVVRKVVIRETRVKNMLVDILVYVLPLLVAVIILSPFLSEFFTFYFKVALTLKSLMSIVEIPLYVGAHLLPLVVVGFIKSVREMKNQGQHREEFALLVSWGVSIIGGTLVVPFSGINLPQWRIMVFFPVPLFAAIGLNHVVKSIKEKKTRLRYNYRKLILIVLAISVIIINSYVAILYSDNWMRPYISENTYQSLRWIEQNYNFSQKPIVVCYFSAGDFTPGVFALYRNWIDTTIGNHYSFFGKLHYLLGGYAMPFQDPDLNSISLASWTELGSISSDVYDHPILVIPSDFYPSPSPNEKTLLNEIAPKIFMLKEDFLSIPNLHDIRLAAYRDSYSSSQNWYATKKDWSSEDNVAEHVEDLPKSQFNMTFSLPINGAGNYTIKVRIQDYYISSAPVKVTLDNVTISTIYYGGTMQPKIFTLQVNNLTRNLHYITLTIDDLNKPHRISLDYVECLLEDAK